MLINTDHDTWNQICWIFEYIYMYINIRSCNIKSALLQPGIIYLQMLLHVIYFL